MDINIQGMSYLTDTIKAFIPQLDRNKIINQLSLSRLEIDYIELPSRQSKVYSSDSSQLFLSASFWNEENYPDSVIKEKNKKIPAYLYKSRLIYRGKEYVNLFYPKDLKLNYSFEHGKIILEISNPIRETQSNGETPLLNDFIFIPDSTLPVEIVLAKHFAVGFEYVDTAKSFIKYDRRYLNLEPENKAFYFFLFN